MKRLIAITATVAIVGCGGDDTDPQLQDAPPVDTIVDPWPPPTCWPETPSEARGTVTLGTGHNGYEPMPADLRIEWGPQDGYMLFGHVRMSGMSPGSATDLFHPSNPIVRMRAYFDDTNVPLNRTAECGLRFGFKDTGGQYDLVREIAVMFDTCWRAPQLVGKKVRVELEVMDVSGGYAKDTKVVTLAEPLGEYPRDEGSVGCEVCDDGGAVDEDADGMTNCMDDECATTPLCN